MWILEVLGFIGCCLIALWAGRRYEKWLIKMVERKKAKKILEAENRKEVVVKGETIGFFYAHKNGEKNSILGIELTEPVVVDGEVIHVRGELVNIHYKNEDIIKWYQSCMIEVQCYFEGKKLIAKRVG